MQDFGGGRTIGRLRLSALTGDAAGKAVPAEIVKILQDAGQANAPRPRRTGCSTIAWSRTRPSAEMREQLAELREGQEAAAAHDAGDAGAARAARHGRVSSAATTARPASRSQPGSAGRAARRCPRDRRTALALARWLVDRDNPLVARVTVNRWWAELFGHGLVSTVEDFGIKGEPPTHPELLDWLAVEFMESGWSMKHVLRTIVLSATYRQSSRVTPELLARDDQNLLYARGPRFRLDAEMIRDNALAVAGPAEPEAVRPAGPAVSAGRAVGEGRRRAGRRTRSAPGEDRYRRGIYVVWKRASPYPSFVNFDATARLACTVKRSRSNTPLQALTLLNDPVYVEAALALARRVLDRAARGAARGATAARVPALPGAIAARRRSSPSCGGCTRSS